MSPLDILGHFGYALLAGGLWLVGQKNRLGFLLRLLGEVIWISIGFQLGFTSIVIWGLIDLYINGKAYLKWAEDENV